ncbi:MAG: 50S ribosomal protein L11 methyltransferase, partial [Bacteroidetes bacterium]|nr:50S ribosomal protein L11 methyltransferase [Bacteroidota bacterium]
MKRYTEATFLIEPLDPWRDLLIAELGELGYDSFEETSNGVNAYISADRFDRAALHRLEIAR